MRNIQHTYQRLLNDCREIITEFGFTHRWALIELYWSLGKKIEEYKLDSVTVTQLANDLGKSRRTIERASQFYKKFPDLNVLPEGKNTSWHMIVNKYLPEQVEEKHEEEKLLPVDKDLLKCPNCGFMFSENDIDQKQSS